MKTNSIATLVMEARNNKSAGPLRKAIVEVVRQRRLLELAYGLYCAIRYRPSVLAQIEDPSLLPITRLPGILESRTREWPHLEPRILLSELFGKYPLDLLPRDLRARAQTIAVGENWVVIGEYAHSSARLCLLTHSCCTVNDYYNSIPRVRHIHSIHKSGEDEVLVATGDSAKRLDAWVVDRGRLCLSRRVIKRLAGFTASATVRGEYYFGTDFDMRPNFILRLSDRHKFFYPGESYLTYALSFDVLEDRYIASMNATQDTEHPWALTLFDTSREEFVYTASIANLFSKGLPDTSPRTVQ